MRRSAPHPRCVVLVEFQLMDLERLSYLKEDTERWENDSKNDLANIAAKCQFLP
jgi:hypothetical protein